MTYCCDCEDPIEDRDYSMTCECGDGPFCETCWQEHIAVCVFEAEMEEDADD